jgi:hypothetical protein
MLHVLVESKAAEALLAELLHGEQEAGFVHVQFIAFSSSLYASARTLLAVRDEPVAVVLNADSTNPAAAGRRRQEAEEVIGWTANTAPLRILVAVPALEALLFRRPDAIARAGGHLAPDVLELGQFSPRDALEKLDRNGLGHGASLKIIAILNDADVVALRAVPPVREVLEFLSELQREGVASAAVGGL